MKQQASTVQHGGIDVELSCDRNAFEQQTSIDDSNEQYGISTEQRLDFMQHHGSTRRQPSSKQGVQYPHTSITDGPSDLQQLTDEVVYFPDCCLGLSKPLIDALIETLVDCADYVLSIGCGSGLLEAYLHEAGMDCGLHIVGVDVSSSLNHHLPASRFVIVSDTRALYAEAIMATALIFAYPRPASLVARYLEAFAHGALQRVVILTHRDDLSELRRSMQGYEIDVEDLDKANIASHEIGMVLALSSGL